MGVILPGVDGTGFSPSFFVGLGWEKINFCGSGTGEVWEFTPVSPSSVYFIIIHFFYPRNVWFTLSGYWVLWSNKNLCFHSCFWHHRISRALQLCWFCARSWMNEKCDLFKGTKSLLGNIHLSAILLSLCGGRCLLKSGCPFVWKAAIIWVVLVCSTQLFFFLGFAEWF